VFSINIENEVILT